MLTLITFWHATLKQNVIGSSQFFSFHILVRGNIKNSVHVWVRVWMVKVLPFCQSQMWTKMYRWLFLAKKKERRSVELFQTKTKTNKYCVWVFSYSFYVWSFNIYVYFDVSQHVFFLIFFLYNNIKRFMGRLNIIHI